MLISQYNNSYNPPTFCADASKLTRKKLQKFVDKGFSDYKIADIVGLSHTSVREKRKKYGMDALYTPSHIDYDKYDFYYLRTLIDEGNTMSQIAQFYNEKVSRIRKVLSHFGLKTQEAVLASAIKKEELSSLISQGKTMREIADNFFLQEDSTVTHVIKKFGLEMPVHKVDRLLTIHKIADLIFRGMKPAEIAQKYGVDVSSIKHKMKASGFNEVYQELYQPHDIPKREIIDLLRSGYSVSEIAEINHVSLYQMVQYMVKNKILKTNIPLKDLVNSVKSGMSIIGIAQKHELFKSRVYKLLADNNLRTRGQRLYDPIPRDIVENNITGCKTYKELAQKLNVSVKRVKTLLTRYGLDLERDTLVLPKVEDISKIMLTNPKISVDELAHSLDVKPEALERVLNKSKIKIYTPHKVRDFSSYNFARWVSYNMRLGDSPVQLAELLGISSTKARKILEKLADEYQGADFLQLTKIPIDKSSPTSENILRELIQSSKDYIYPKENPYNYSQIYLAKDFLKVKICEKYAISDTTLDYLLNKYDLKEIFDSYAFKMAKR